MSNTEPRGEIRIYAPRREGWGTSRVWNREMRGKLYSFTAVTMPDGELRYSVSRWDGGGRPGEPGHPNFACEWTRVFGFTVKATYHATQSAQFPRTWYVHTVGPERHGMQFDVGTVHRSVDGTFRAVRYGDGHEGTPDGQDAILGDVDTLDEAVALFRSHWL